MLKPPLGAYSLNAPSCIVVPEWATEEEAEGNWLHKDSPPWPNSPRSPEASS